MRFTSFAVWAAVAILFAAGCSQQPSQNQATSLNGDWAVISMHGDGVAATPAELRNMRWSVQGREIVGFGPDGSSGKMSFTLDESKTPQEIDITAIEGNRKGETDPAIYSLEKQRLRICLAEIGNGRPREFRVSRGAWIMELERIRR